MQQSFPGDILSFLAEGPGAQLFMILMGVFFVFSQNTGWRIVWKRAVILLGAGYSLNIIKFIVPLQLGWIPQNLLQDLSLQDDRQAFGFFVFIGDTFHFAGLAYLILFIVTRLKHHPYWSLCNAFAIMLISPYLWDLKSRWIFVNYMLQLLGGQPPNVYFPFFPWIVYPLTGLALGHLLKKYDPDEVMHKTGIFSLIIMVITWIISPWPSITGPILQKPVFTWHLSSPGWQVSTGCRKKSPAIFFSIYWNFAAAIFHPSISFNGSSSAGEYPWLVI